jgi:hypothetical protein
MYYWRQSEKEEKRSCLPDKRETRGQALSDQTHRTQKGERKRERLQKERRGNLERD